MGSFFKSKKFRIILCVVALLIGVMLYAVTQDDTRCRQPDSWERFSSRFVRCPIRFPRR